MSTSPTTDHATTDHAIEALERAAGCSWPTIAACAASAIAERAHLSAKVEAEKLIPPDCSFVVFGSLARNELTNKSDLDWTLLVDGQCDTQHSRAAQAISKIVKTDRGGKERKAPGPTALFGTLAFSHELVHLIGGEVDSNRNTTRRILLLLESKGMAPDDAVRDRVLRSVLKRYLQEDLGYHELHRWQVRVPRFLLNDIVRFWRTMTVDYAAKRRDRAGDGWAIRNFKLRVSRKLIFTAGLAMCLSCELFPPALLSNLDPARPADFYGVLEDHLVAFSNLTPLEVIAGFILRFNAIDAGRQIFDAYDQFLSMLEDEDKRLRLELLGVEGATSDKVFQEARSIGTSFQDGLAKLFFETDPMLTKTTQRYGVF